MSLSPSTSVDETICSRSPFSGTQLSVPANRHPVGRIKLQKTQTTVSLVHWLRAKYQTDALRASRKPAPRTGKCLSFLRYIFRKRKCRLTLRRRFLECQLPHKPHALRTSSALVP